MCLSKRKEKTGKRRRKENRSKLQMPARMVMEKNLGEFILSLEQQLSHGGRQQNTENTLHGHLINVILRHFIDPLKI